MDRKSLLYSGVLLLSLVVVAVMLNRGMVQAVLNADGIILSSTSSPSEIGGSRHFDAELRFPNLEEATLSGAQLVVTQVDTTTSTTTLDIMLPLAFVSTSPTTTEINLVLEAGGLGNGTVTVEYIFTDIQEITSASSTLPGGGKFKGIDFGATLFYTIWWDIPDTTTFIGDYEAVLNAHVLGPGGGNIIPSNNGTPVTFSIIEVQEVTIVVPLVEGLNLITIPANPETPITSSDMMQQIIDEGGSASLALNWRTDIQQFRTQVQGFPTNEFNVTPGLGFFVFIDAGGVPASGGWTVTGSPFTAPVPLTLVGSLNLIGVPYTDKAGGYNSSELMQAIIDAGGDATLALNWRTDIQQFRTQVQGFPTNEFVVVPGLGFFIFIDAGGPPPGPFVP